MSMKLFCDFYSVTFGIKDNTFVIPITGNAWLLYYDDAFIGHFLGEAIYLFF